MSGHELFCALGAVLAMTLVSTSGAAVTMVAQPVHLEAVAPIPVPPRTSLVRNRETEPYGWLLAIVGSAAVGIFSRRRLARSVTN